MNLFRLYSFLKYTPADMMLASPKIPPKTVLKMKYTLYSLVRYQIRKLMMQNPKHPKKDVHMYVNASSTVYCISERRNKMDIRSEEHAEFIAVYQVSHFALCTVRAGP